VADHVNGGSSTARIEVEKAFVMLNVYAGFEMASTRATCGDYASALGVLEPLRDSVAAWITDHPDPDIEDDLRYIEKYIDNLRRHGAEPPPPQ
jgi:Ca-activated chloride channel family protein